MPTTPTRMSVLITTLVDATHLREGQRSGLLMMGRDYSYIAVIRTAMGLRVVHVVCIDAARGGVEKEASAFEVQSNYVYLRVSVVGEAICAFSYSVDGKRFHGVRDIFKAVPGMWIGAKVGLFAIGPASGYADYNWFRFGPLITRMNKND